MGMALQRVQPMFPCLILLFQRTLRTSFDYIILAGENIRNSYI